MFEATLPAGVYRWHIDAGDSTDSHYLHCTYSTFADREQVNITDGMVTYFERPAMVGFSNVNGRDYGTATDIVITAELITACDWSARHRLDLLESAVDELILGGA